QFAATGTYSDNSTQNLTSQVTWASATPAVATITTAGLATGVAAGTSTISATLTGVTGSTVLTVTSSSASVSGVSALWGTQSAVLQTATDGIRLLPAGRNVDLPWFGVNRLSLSLSQAAV